MEDPCSKDYLGYPLREFTSSGLNLKRGNMAKLGFSFFSSLFPDTYGD